jgi:hypothetical protein
LHLQSLATTPFPRRVDVRQAVSRKNKLTNIYHSTLWDTGRKRMIRLAS